MGDPIPSERQGKETIDTGDAPAKYDISWEHVVVANVVDILGHLGTKLQQHQQQSINGVDVRIAGPFSSTVHTQIQYMFPIWYSGYLDFEA